MSKRKKPAATCLAIIICEGVVEDARSHNKCILNLFNAIWAAGVPVTQDRFTVFVTLTGIHGELPVRLTLGQDGEEPVATIDGTVKAESPRGVADLVLNMRSVPLKAFGEYVVNVEVGDEIIGTRRVQVIQAKKTGGK